jgi:TRAP-type C4-dicarboxylate transport system permease small subunit
MKRAYMDRFIDTIEWIAAGFVGLVAANIFVSVLLRNLFSYSIPDSFDIGRLFLGILIFWGIAATSYRGTHITVDLIWANVGPKYQRIIDVFATLVLLFVGRRRLRRAADRDPHLSADLQPGPDARPQDQGHGIA